MIKNTTVALILIAASTAMAGEVERIPVGGSYPITENDCNVENLQRITGSYLKRTYGTLRSSIVGEPQEIGTEIRSFFTVTYSAVFTNRSSGQREAHIGQIIVVRDTDGCHIDSDRYQIGKELHYSID